MDILLVLAGLAGITLLALMAWLVRAIRGRQWVPALILTGAVSAVAGLGLVFLLPLYLDHHLPDKSLEPLPRTAIKVDGSSLEAVFSGRAHRGTLFDAERETWVWFEENHASDGTIAGLGGSLTGPETWSWNGTWGLCLTESFDLPRQCLSVYAVGERYAFARDDGRIVLSGTLDADSEDTAQD